MKLAGKIDEGILQDREKQLKDLKQGGVVNGGGYGPFKKTGRDTFVSPKGKKYNSSALIKFIGTFGDFKIDEAYKGNSSDFKTDIVNALDNVGISSKAIKKISKKGKGFEVRMSSYMSNKDTWEKLGDAMGAKLVDFQKGSINIGLYESVEINEKADYKYLTQTILDAKPKHNVYYNSGHNKVNIGGVGYDGGDLVKNFNQKPGSSSKIKNNFYYADQDPQTTKREVEKLSNGKIKVDIQKGYGGKPMAVYVVKESVNEAKVKRPVNRWLELKNDDTMHPHKKMAMGLKELKHQLAETEKFFNWYNKIKNINELDSDKYWKRTNNHIYKIKERLVNIAKTLKEIEK